MENSGVFTGSKSYWAYSSLSHILIMVFACMGNVVKVEIIDATFLTRIVAITQIAVVLILPILNLRTDIAVRTVCCT